MNIEVPVLAQVETGCHRIVTITSHATRQRAQHATNSACRIPYRLVGTVVRLSVKLGAARG